MEIVKVYFVDSQQCSLSQCRKNPKAKANVQRRNFGLWMNACSVLGEGIIGLTLKERTPHGLTKVYSWFTEGFDTKDLQEARAPMKTLSGVKNKTN